MTAEYHTLWQGDYISVVSPKDTQYECVLDSNCVLAVPIKDGLIGIRSEVVPSYEILDESMNTHFYTVVAGMVEYGESYEDALYRELKEETGVTILEGELFEFSTIPLFKVLANRFKLFVVDIKEYTEEEHMGDGGEIEAESTTEWVTMSELKSIITTGGNYDMTLLLAYYILLDRGVL